MACEAKEGTIVSQVVVIFRRMDNIRYEREKEREMSVRPRNPVAHVD